MSKPIKQTNAIVDLVTKAKNHEKEWDQYWHGNVESFVNDTMFINVSTNTPNDLKMLKVNKQPQIQFNITKPYVARENSKFLEMQPSFTFKIKDGFPVTPKNQLLAGFLQNLFAATYRPQDNDWALAKARNDCTNGGFSGLYIYPDYVNNHTTHQKVCIKKVDNVCQMGFDPTAKTKTKEDGEYCFYREYPSVAEIKRWYGVKAAEAASTRAGRQTVGYEERMDSDETVRVTYYWYKKWYKKTIVKLSTGQHMDKALAKEVIEAWKPGKMSIKISIVEEREVDRYSICKLVYAHNGYVLEHDANTLYNELPIVYVDGQSEMVATDTTGTMMHQRTASLIQHAIDIQRTKNAMGQSIVGAAQNIGVTRWSVSLQALPQKLELQKAFFDPDAGRAVLWNEVDPKNPNTRLTPPREVNFPGATPDQFQMFTYMDTLFQSALATFDPSTPSISRNDMSGKAIYAGDAQAQMVSQPGMLGMTAAMAQLAKIELHLLTQIIKDERSMPQTTNGSDIDHVPVNSQDPNGISFDFDSDMFSIEVSPGVSTQLQKTQTLESILNTAKLLPSVAQFCNDPETVPHILRLLPGGDLDRFILQYDKYLEKMKQQPPQPSPEQISAQNDQQKLELEKTAQELKAFEMMMDGKLKTRDQDITLLKTMADVQSGQEKDDVEAAQALAGIDNQAMEMELKKQAIDAENLGHAVDLLKGADEHQIKLEQHEMAKQNHAKMMRESTQQSNGADAS